MPKENIIKFANFSAIILCLSIVFGFYAFFIKADPGAKIQFTADTIVSLSGITDGDLYIAQNSEADSLSVSGSALADNVLFNSFQSNVSGEVSFTYNGGFF